MKHFQLHGGLAIFLCLLLCHAPSHAEHNVEELTEANIRHFVEDITNKANDMRASSMAAEDMSEFFAAHLHPNAFFKSSVSYDIPGFPQQENKLTYDKEQYINSLVHTKDMVKDFQADVSIQNIKISSDKTKATLKTVTNETATMIVPQSGMTEYVPMNGYSSCDQILMLSAASIIQIYSANCKTEMSFESLY